MSTHTLTLERLIQAPQRLVFENWTSTEALRQWHCGTVADVKMELTVGGEFMIEFEPEEQCPHAIVRGNYLEIETPSKLKYSWKWDGSDAPDSIVTVDFIQQGSEETLLKITHELLDSDKSKSDHQMGWEACLLGIQKLMTGESEPTESCTNN